MTNAMHPEGRLPASATDASIGRIVSVTGAKAIVLLDSKSGSARLMDERYPVYALADVTVKTRDEKREIIADEVIEAVATLLADGNWKRGRDG